MNIFSYSYENTNVRSDRGTATPLTEYKYGYDSNLITESQSDRSFKSKRGFIPICGTGFHIKENSCSRGTGMALLVSFQHL